MRTTLFGLIIHINLEVRAFVISEHRDQAGTYDPVPVFDEEGLYIRSGMSDYLLDQKSSFVSIPHCVDSVAGVFQYLQAVIKTRKVLTCYYHNEGVPRMLNGTNYKIMYDINILGLSKTVIAEDITKKVKVIIDVPLQQTDEESARDLLYEYMQQNRAAKALSNAACTTPFAIGFVRTKAPDDEFHTYMMVSELVPIISGSYATLTVKTALQKQKEKPLLGRSEWKHIIYDLVDAVDILQRNAIYHNNIKTDSILLHFIENEAKPVLINYCFSRPKYEPDNRTPTVLKKIPKEKRPPHIADELYERPQPLPTSDLYSIAHVALKISQALNLPHVQKYIEAYRKEHPIKRGNHETFKENIARCFALDVAPITDTIDLT